MFISLQINNVDVLPAGLPLGYRSRDRSFEIGRENCAWTLPDPDKFISGRHCQVRYEGGAFWLHDVSRNGTFVNGSNQRLVGPHRLAQGDRLRIGRYVVSISIDDERAAFATTDHAGGSHGSTQRQMPTGVGHGPERSISPPSQIMPVPAASGRANEAEDILRKIAAGAGIPPEVLLLRPPHEVAGEIGAVLRVVVDELVLLLKARAAAKVLAKTSDRTMINSVDNNPLKFVPGTDEILDIMFARRRAGYLDARHSIEDAFHDLKTHEFATFAAMQAALSRLLDDLSPEAIAKKLPPSSFASKKPRAWDAFVATWRAKEEAHENGMLDIFLAYFSEAYAKAAKQKQTGKP
ncbi:type VI secretion system-associated FHA domain protein TagH [Mesorhizobium sp. AR10]|uniref:type VI secretion system-associated FHA domain protein TagH n=1 Tax=Mesorhizobium sp. AR10 TaxID=2865839 RepID=UPI00215F3853|nr:type VI secretion system-associated FHA domain protein TagH [Mesorhizobium sp. AR10]UVK38461.1 type VI secretion system-associated FHA domain protein TagH [Mesorhizobium sp. AR10]